MEPHRASDDDSSVTHRAFARGSSTPRKRGWLDPVVPVSQSHVVRPAQAGMALPGSSPRTSTSPPPRASGGSFGLRTPARPEDDLLWRRRESHRATATGQERSPIRPGRVVVRTTHAPYKRWWLDGELHGPGTAAACPMPAGVTPMIAPPGRAPAVPSCASGGGPAPTSTEVSTTASPRASGGVSIDDMDAALFTDPSPAEVDRSAPRSAPLARPLPCVSGGEPGRMCSAPLSCHGAPRQRGWSFEHRSQRRRSIPCAPRQRGFPGARPAGGALFSPRWRRSASGSSRTRARRLFRSGGSGRRSPHMAPRPISRSRSARLRPGAAARWP